MVGDAVGDDAAVQSGEAVPVDGRDAAPALQGGVVVGDDADVDAGVGGAEPVRGDTRVFQRLPGQFQNEALLGVHRGGFAG